LLTAAQLDRAAQLIRAGKLVAFPTETVYGLGANALDPAAVERIYEAKGRPHSSPIIVHVYNLEMVRRVVAEWPEKAQKLANAFWPGPLTLVLPRTVAVPDVVTAGLQTVGVRMPAHPIAWHLVRLSALPIAAPSANRFTQVSPTTAEHVRQSLGDRVDYILDGGSCEVGIESTVLTLTEAVPRILRPGGVSRTQIEAVIGAVEYPIRETEFPGRDGVDSSGAAHLSPGQHPRHYSPKTRLILVDGGTVPEQGKGAYLRICEEPRRVVAEVVGMPSDAEGYAAKLYLVLHALDVRGYDWIAVENPPATVEWEAVQDRLCRAAYGDE
jgi:L-threonylcarbamoyladenylate synthase